MPPGITTTLPIRLDLWVRPRGGNAARLALRACPQGSPCALARKARPAIRIARLAARLAPRFVLHDCPQLLFVDQISGGPVAHKKMLKPDNVDSKNVDTATAKYLHSVYRLSLIHI